MYADCRASIKAPELHEPHTNMGFGQVTNPGRSPNVVSTSPCGGSGGSGPQGSFTRGGVRVETGGTVGGCDCEETGVDAGEAVEDRATCTSGG